MVDIHVDYSGGLRCRATHGPSGSQLRTDAPVDNCGKGELFSPTDLVAAGLASCVLTILGIAGDQLGVSLDGASADVSKEMSTEKPRRIVRLPVTVQLPAGIPASKRDALEQAARSCPVHHSLREDIDAPITFSYPDRAVTRLTALCPLERDPFHKKNSRRDL